MSQVQATTIRAFKAPKSGESTDSCRDAWWNNHYEKKLAPPACLRVAIADGASTASGSGLWAQLLARASVNGLNGLAPGSWCVESYRSAILRRLRVKWHEQIRRLLPDPLPWFSQAALERGAFSSLMQVEVGGGIWTAEGWGDSCLFQLRGGQPVQILPDLKPEAFDENPFLLASVRGHDGDLVKNMLTATGKLEPGDTLLLATDALACWLLTTRAWSETLREFMSLADEAAFSVWVEELRRERGLKNDDTTMVLVEFQ